MDGKWPYITNVFSKLYKIMVNKVTLVGFREDVRPNHHPIGSASGMNQPVRVKLKFQDRLTPPFF